MSSGMVTWGIVLSLPVIRVEFLPEVGELGEHRLAAPVGVALVVEHILQGDPPMRAALVMRNLALIEQLDEIRP